MSLSSAVLLVLAVVTLGARGDEDTINSVAVDAANSTSNQSSSAPVLLLLLNFLNNNTLGNETTPGESQGNSSGIPESRAVLLITTLVGPAANGTEDGSNTTALMGNPVKRLTEEPHTSIPKLAASEARLIRRKRTFSKHKGCMICGIMSMMKHKPSYHQPMYQPQPQPCNTCYQQQPVYHPPPPPPPPPPVQQPYCDPCQRRHQPQQHYPPPPPPQPSCGGNCGGGGGTWSHSSSSAQSSSGSWGKKK